METMWRWICIKHQFKCKNIIIKKNVKKKYHKESRALESLEVIAASINTVELELSEHDGTGGVRISEMFG